MRREDELSTYRAKKQVQKQNAEKEKAKQEEELKKKKKQEKQEEERKEAIKEVENLVTPIQTLEDLSNALKEGGALDDTYCSRLVANRRLWVGHKATKVAILKELRGEFIRIALLPKGEPIEAAENSILEGLLNLIYGISFGEDENLLAKEKGYKDVIDMLYEWIQKVDAVEESEGFKERERLMEKLVFLSSGPRAPYVNSSAAVCCHCRYFFSPIYIYIYYYYSLLLLSPSLYIYTTTTTLHPPPT